jgi:pyruvate-ferredoxin/flavodoxin oxidoreductase
MKELKYTLALSAYDCTGCGLCANECPGKKGNTALVMENMEANVIREQSIFDYCVDLPEKPEVLEKFAETTVKGSQFKKPLFQFSGACAGCGETQYIKLITQLFGDRMFIGNATGCSSIYGNSSPSTPYTVNDKGQGPAWCNSLFEDTAEFSYGMMLGHDIIRTRLKEKTEVLLETSDNKDVKAAAKEYLATYSSGATNGRAVESYIKALEACDCKRPECVEILKEKDFLSKKSVWAFGGDGWAYDIGFGGLDHVIATGEDVNLLVMDTEVYSNTGGQASKATPLGAIAQFAANGSDTKKKDLASICMSYGDVYVAQIGLGADYNQTIKAIVEAEAYPGPSVIIAYSPCINHGIKGGMAKSQEEIAKAVKAGYWHNFRYNPMLETNKFILDSKEPEIDVSEFLETESRYSTLMRINPDKANELFEQANKDAKARYRHLTKLVKLYED